jgi:hypothetical protein
MTSEHQREQQERRETLRNDQRLHEREAARHEGKRLRRPMWRSHLGRFGALGNPHLTGSAAIQQWPKLPEGNPWSGPDLVGDELPLSVPLA